jgi:hypothetical protein
MLHLRRKEQVPYAITQLLSPFLWFHELTSRFIASCYTMKAKILRLITYLCAAKFNLNVALADPSNPCQGGVGAKAS